MEIKENALWTLLLNFTSAREMYKNLKANDFARQRTTLFGRKALINIIWLTIMAALSVFVAYLMVLEFSKLALITGVLAAIGLVLCAVILLTRIIVTLNQVVKQLKLNKKAIGYIALALYLIVLIATVVLIVLIF